MAGEFIEFFEELLFGSGAYLGLLLIVCVILLLTVAVKYSAIFTVPFSVLMIGLYLENASPYNNFMWASVLMVFVIVLVIAIEYKRKDT